MAEDRGGQGIQGFERSRPEPLGDGSAEGLDPEGVPVFGVPAWEDERSVP